MWMLLTTTAINRDIKILHHSFRINYGNLGNWFLIHFHKSNSFRNN